LKKLEQEKFDLLIVDYLVPGPNGIEIVRWVRKHGMNIPALVITNYPSDELSENSKTLGHTKFLAKTSFSISSMPKIIQEMLSS
jgi:CheY-like chemotaxis protein